MLRRYRPTSCACESSETAAPREAKGLEFDHVVVVEPAAIAGEGGDAGLRELYVALTRPTKTLTVVYARDMPEPLEQGDTPP